MIKAAAAFLVAALLLASGALRADPLDTGEVALRTSVIVEGNYITLGDLFDNAGANAEKNVAYAPQPGRRATFDGKWLYRVATAYGLKWRPFSLNVRSVVERASQQIEPDEVRDAVTSALRGRGVKGDVDIELSSATANLYVAADKPSTVGVEGLSFDPTTGRFVATIAVPANDPAAVRTRVSGVLHKLVSVPVLAEDKRRGDVIKPTDITWRKARSNEVRDHVITDEDDLVGMAVKRDVRASAIIHTSELTRPVLVTKNALVTMALVRGGMSLSVQGKAMDEGSLGDTIRVANLTSNKVVEGKITGQNRVDVDFASALAQAH
jgi:flagella basal body P-ring formation protein FlgA